MSNRYLEQKALRNVRALLDDLGGAELSRRHRQVVALAAIGVAVAVLAVAVLALGRRGVTDQDQRARLSCEIDGWNRKSADFERKMREEHPEWLYREIQASLERQRNSLMAAARADCDTRLAAQLGR